jgi:hypothetical protein
MTQREDPATPTSVRCVSSYPARRNYRPGVVFPPLVPGVKGAIDIHCHAHDGQQDALALAKLASESGMRGIVFKTIGAFAGKHDPMHYLQPVIDELNKWADEQGIEPVHCWAGYGVTRDNRPPTAEKLRRNLDQGVRAIWLPVANHANTLFKVGGKPIWWDKNASPKDHTEPMPWEEALKYGFYMLDEKGRLKPEFEESIRIVADSDAALFFGHATHPEIWAVAELVEKLGYKRAVIDHPFSPFIDLSIDEMKQLARIGVTLNFTFDELSPLLGVDPARMYAAIRAVGPEHCSLSSDGGEPLFPHSVECMRLVRGYMEAFGMNEAELDIMCSRNPAKVVGLH